MRDIYILYNDHPFPDGWGLYVDAAERTIQAHNYVVPNFTVRGTTLMIAAMCCILS